MTNVLLVNPPEKTDITRVLELRAPPMSLMYLGASLEQAGLSVEILDANLFDMSMPQIQHEIGKRSIDFIGATCTTATVKNGMRIVNRARKALPDVVTALGGVHPTFLPARTLQECPELDMVVVGEGENTIVELSRALDGFRWGDHNRYKDEKAREFVDRLSKVNGLALRDPDDPYNADKVKLTPPRPYIKDLDTVPLPARHLVPFDQYRLLGKTTAIGTVITSRGCPYACGYCSSTRIAGIRFRARSPKNVMEEISLLHDKYRLETIEFIDDIFTLNQKRAMEFCGMVRDYGLDIDWVASSRVNTVSRELMSAMAKTGLRTLYFGVESGTQHVLDLMGKAARLQQAIDSFKIAHESGVQPMGAFILGYPGETLAEMEETINFAIKLEPDYAQFSVLTPYPGTPVYDDLKSKGLLLTEDWDKYTVLEPVVKYEAFGYTNKDVRNKLKRAYYRFYFRPSYLKKHAHMVPVAIKTLFKAQIMPKIRTMFKPLWNSSNYDADYDKLESLAGNLPMEGDLRVN